MSTGVSATTTCGAPEGRTLRLVRLAGTMAYGYEGELTPWSTRDEERGDPKGVPHAIASCDLTTGTVRLLQGPTGSPGEFSASIVDFDRGRLLLRAGNRESVATWLLDLATGSLTTIDAFVERGVAPLAIGGNFVVGSWTIDDSFSDDSLPAVYSLETGDFRIVTPTDLGVGGTWIEPLGVENGILVGTTDNAHTDLLGEAWVFILDTGEAIELPPVLTAARPYIGAFDGSMIVGSAFRNPRDRHAQPFMWRLGRPDVTWLSLPEGQVRGRAVALQGHLSSATPKRSPQARTGARSGGPSSGRARPGRSWTWGLGHSSCPGRERPTVAGRRRARRLRSTATSSSGSLAMRAGRAAHRASAARRSCGTSASGSRRSGPDGGTPGWTAGRRRNQETPRWRSPGSGQGSGGAKGIRTLDLLNAIQTLFQLSYSPVPERGA